MYGNRFGMFIVNPFVFSQAGGYIVDDYSPIAAYSLRKLSSTATNAIRVRRSSDNAEQDIGFSGDDLDTASLSSFVGANSAYVVTWYNQGTGGATYDASQATAANQPRIVNAGTIETKGGKSAVLYDGTDKLVSSSTIFQTTYPYDLSIFAVGNHNVSNSYGFIVQGNPSGSANVQMFLDRRTQSRNTILYGATGVNTYNMSAQDDTSNQRLLSFFMSSGGAGSSFKDSIAGTSGTVGGGTTTGTTMIIGGLFTGNVQEVLLFSSYESTNRTAIESDINSYYSIY